jgi:hypothetical protein
MPEVYATPREWLEGKRRFVRILRQLCGSSREDRRNSRVVPAKPDREVLMAALNWHEQQHILRECQTGVAGIKLPIEEFAAEHKLDDVEREIVEMLLVAATDLTRDNGSGGLETAEVALLLARGRRESVQDYLPYFLPGGHLKTVFTREVPFWEPFGSRCLSMNEEVVARLLGVDCEQSGALAKSGHAAEPWHGDIAEFLSNSGVVLGSAALESIRTLWGYVRRLDIIREKWGFGSLHHVSGGACLLFHGPSGTGKTLTARVLCQALGREPLVISYPDLVSKWVGDTEKNTKAAFAKAAKADKVLIFDEADAVFARRTEVRTSTDRFANGEVNTLLMEVEKFPGIVVLTTNLADVFDTALQRRIKYKVYFGPPDAEARSEIWRKHLPKEAPLAPDVDLGRLAGEFKLTGGQIANAVLSAASRAASRLEEDTDTGQMMMADFEAAAQRELNGYAAEGSNGRLGF